jgi:hypothetical protein
MTLGIMQPYFFPYLGYFSLIRLVDKFLLLDNVQFIRHGWVDRNQIVGKTGVPFYFRPSLIKHSQKTSIDGIFLNSNQSWQNTILEQLKMYRNKAPFYELIIDLIREIIFTPCSKLAELNYESLTQISEYIGIKTTIERINPTSYDWGKVKEADDWALIISKTHKAKEYINPAGGMKFFDKNKFDKEGIKLAFLKPVLSPYRQLCDTFIPSMSVIDALMFLEPGEVLNQLDQFELLE